MIEYTLNRPESRFWVAMIFGFYLSTNKNQNESEAIAITKFNLKLADEIDSICLPWTTHYCPPNFPNEHIAVRACDVPPVMSRVKRIPDYKNFILTRGILYGDQDLNDCRDYDLFLDRGYIIRPTPEWLLIEKEGDIFERDLEHLPDTVETVEELYYLYRAGFFDKTKSKKVAVWKKIVELYQKNEERIRGKTLKNLILERTCTISHH